MILEDKSDHFVGVCGVREREKMSEREREREMSLPTQFKAAESSLRVRRDGPNTTPKFTNVILLI